MATKLPSKERIGPHDYEFVEWGEKDSGEDTASICHNALKIWVLTSEPSSIVVESVLHETLHGIEQQWGVEEGDDGEQRVTKMARGILAFFRDNPGVIDWIRDQLAVEGAGG